MISSTSKRFEAMTEQELRSWTFKKDGDGFGERAFFEEEVLLLSEDSFVCQAGFAETSFRQFADVVHGHTAASQRNTLHVPSFGPSQGNDAFFGQHVQREGVDTLLVNENESLSIFWGADFLFKFDDLLTLSSIKARSAATSCSLSAAVL